MALAVVRPWFPGILHFVPGNVPGNACANPDLDHINEFGSQEFPGNSSFPQFGTTPVGTTPGNF